MILEKDLKRAIVPCAGLQRWEKAVDQEKATFQGGAPSEAPLPTLR
jgi:hypothetical protein